jgi:Calponin homology (CH) domain
MGPDDATDLNRWQPSELERDGGLTTSHPNEETQATSLSSRLQSIPHESNIRLMEAMRLRGYCISDRCTYETIAPRPAHLPGLQAPSSALDNSEQSDRGGPLDRAPVDSGPCVRLGGSMRRLVEGPKLGLLMGPVPVPLQEDLCRVWIQRRTGAELDQGRPLADALVNGYLLCRLINIQPAAQPPRINIPWHIAERNIALFLRVAPKKGLAADDLFEAQDLLYRRNTPSVLRTVAAIARRTDPEGFGAVAAELPGSRLQWTMVDEPDEFWRGDWMITRIVRTYQRWARRSKLGIVVYGSQGSGKSATMDMLMGRQFMEPSHAIRYMPEDSFFDEKEQRIIRDFRRAAVKHWPHPMFERGTPTSSNEVCKMYVKIAGVSVQVAELPSMETHIERAEVNGILLTYESGRFETVVRHIAGDEVELVLLVERLDQFSGNRVIKMCRKLHRLYGDKVWSRTVVILTHGCCLPPTGVNYEDLVGQREREIQSYVRRVSGDPSNDVPVVIVENSASCAVDETTGRPKLPNGTDFQLQFVEALETILSQQQGSKSLRSVGLKRWWQHYVGAAILCWLISRL